MRKTRDVKLFVVIFLVTIFVFAGCGCLSSIFSPSGGSSFPDIPNSDLPNSYSYLDLESPIYIITGKASVEGFLDFWREMDLLYEEVNLLEGYPLVEGVEKYLEDIRKSNVILLISPTPEGIQEFRDLESSYSNLCLISSVELESELEFHSSPLLYFSLLYCQLNDSGSGWSWGGDIIPGCEDGRDKIRGIIVAEEVDSSLAELLSEGVPLDVPFRYENGQLLILE